MNRLIDLEQQCDYSITTKKMRHENTNDSLLAADFFNPGLC